MTGPLVCKHGQQRRACELCELMAEVELLRERVNPAKARIAFQEWMVERRGPLTATQVRAFVRDVQEGRHAHGMVRPLWQAWCAALGLTPADIPNGTLQ
jgi:hypothetical protein